MAGPNKTDAKVVAGPKESLIKPRASLDATQCLIGLVLFKNTIHIAGFISEGVIPKQIPNSTVIVSNSEGLYE